jgi:hypothetical protein
MKTLLHVGCASLNINDLKGFNNNKWSEIRLDIDISRNPDIVGTLTNME